MARGRLVTADCADEATGADAPQGGAAEGSRQPLRLRNPLRRAGLPPRPGKRLEVGQAGMNRARQLYRVETMCAATLEVYERVLEAHR